MGEYRKIIAAVLLLIGMLLVGMSAAAADPGNFPRLALTNVLVAEGGYTTDPRDPGNRGGNATLNGVIQSVYDADRDARGLPRRKLTRAMLGTAEWADERDGIYRKRYWDPCGGPILPRGVDFEVFSMCVNAGISRGWSMLMKVLGLPTARPWASHAEVLAAITTTGPRATIRLYGAERRRFYTAIAPRTGGVYLRGWLDREARERLAALAMVSGLVQGSGVEMQRSNFPVGKAVEDADELLELTP